MLNLAAASAGDDAEPARLGASLRDVLRPELFALAGFRFATPGELEETLTDGTPPASARRS